MAAPERLHLGQVVGSYQLLGVLGTGSTSTVYLGKQPNNPGTLAAIKVLSLPPNLPEAERMTIRMRFQREVHTASRLYHAHILPILAYGESAGLPYLVSPVADGGTIAIHLARSRGPLPYADIVSYLTQIASALDYAHSCGIVHRDVKPGNMLIDGDGNVLLADFGIAHIFDSGDNALTLATTVTLTTAGQMIGTPLYMAPEQIRGEPVGPATDIYALGVVLYQMVTGQAPFQGETPIAVALQHILQAPRPPGLLRPDLPKRAEEALLRALAKEPAERFATAGAFARAFAEAVALTETGTDGEPVAEQGDRLAGESLHATRTSGEASGHELAPAERITPPALGLPESGVASPVPAVAASAAAGDTPLPGAALPAGRAAPLVAGYQPDWKGSYATRTAAGGATPPAQPVRRGRGIPLPLAPLAPRRLALVLLSGLLALALLISAVVVIGQHGCFGACASTPVTGHTTSRPPTASRLPTATSQTYSVPTWSLAPAHLGTARLGLGAVVVGNTIYALGGKQGNNALASVETYSPGSGAWAASGPPLPAARYKFAVAALGGNIYVLGGKDGANNVLNSVEVYSPAKQQWSTAAPMPIAVWRTAAVALDGRIYVFGGLTNPSDGSGYVGDVQIYTPATNTWTYGAVMPMPRAAMAVIPGPDLRRVYVVGGENGSGALTTVEVYSIQTDTWVLSASNLPSARTRLTGALGPDGAIYVIGGRNSPNGDFLASTLRYLPSQAQWQAGPALTTARDDATAVTLNGKLYVIGGENSSGALDSVEVAS